MSDAASRARTPDALLIGAGALLALGALAIGSVVLGPLTVNVANLAVAILPFLLLLRERGAAIDTITYVTIGCALVGVAFMLFVPHVLDQRTILIGALCVAAYAGLVAFKRGRTGPFLRTDLLIAAVSAAITAAIYRGAYALTADLPNDERSLLVAGHEIHHLNIGIAGALLTWLIAPPGGGWQRALYFVVLGSFLGTWADQSGYYFHPLLSDEDYVSAVSVGGAGASLALFFAIALTAPRQRP